MPFERYLRYDESADADSDGFQAYNEPHPVQFQIPQFILNGPPTLAPGGGAEVMPAMLGNPGSLAYSWFNNNGFNTENLVSGPLTSRDQSHTSYTDVPFDYYPDNHPHYLMSSSSSDKIRVTTSHQSLANTPIHDGRIHMPNHLLSNARLNTPSPLGLPVYSASGFDLLSILSRVATRPHPKIVLGPVDLTCSFVVVDVRRHDRPIVYASPNFCELTGYAEHEVLGRNCRFLQAPDGNVKKGDERRFVAPETVQHMYKSVVADKECQASIVNYRKGGQAFINLVTVIPVTGGLHNRPEEADEVVYQVGFQVDLTEQPNAILQKLQDGSYIVNYGASKPISPSIPLRDRKFNSLSSKAISKDLHSLLADSFFLESLPISTHTTASSPIEKADNGRESSQMLNLLLLQISPDFIHVLSLKGSFLYVAPSVRGVLGFEPEEFVGKSIADFCHPADLVPLMRELKEASANPSVHDEEAIQASSGYAKTVDLLFRAKSKSKSYIWVECRGRLYIESGKGRKAIILSGRARGMLSIHWDAVARAGGLAPPARDSQTMDGTSQGKDQEFWGMLSVQGIFLMVGSGVQDVLGWRASDLIGKTLLSLVGAEGNGRRALEEQLAKQAQGDHPAQIVCEMMGKHGCPFPVQIILYRSQKQTSATWPMPMICQIKREDLFSPPVPPTLTRSHCADIFEELDTRRGSSWQYELQQLKFANKRLIEETDTFEASMLPYDQHLTPTSENHPALDHTRRAMVFSQQTRELESRRSLKRSWDSDSVPS